MSTSKYHGLFGRSARRRCPHADLAGIYGDEINHGGGWRLFCNDCLRYLAGPVSLARRGTDPVLEALLDTEPRTPGAEHEEGQA